MTDRYVADNRSWLEPYIRDLIHLMKLDHWKITIEDEWYDDDDKADAAAWRADDYYRAKLYFREPDDLTSLRQNVVHELVHLMTRDYDRTFDVLEHQLNPPVWHLANKQRDHEMEQVVEAIAYAWSETLPLPVVAKRKAKTS